MRTPHVVPLSTQAVDALRCLEEIRGDSNYVFPGDRDPAKPMSNNTILKALERMGYKHRMTGHGFRGIASSKASTRTKPTTGSRCAEGSSASCRNTCRPSTTWSSTSAPATSRT